LCHRLGDYMYLKKQVAKDFTQKKIIWKSEMTKKKGLPILL